MFYFALYQRLAFEEKYMAKHLPYFRLYYLPSGAYFEGCYKTNSGHREYCLKALLDQHYPDSMPILYVTKPHFLYQYKSHLTINALGLTHAFHTRANGPNGCVQICHLSPSDWNPSETNIGVMLRGLVWLEAYDIYLATGKSIAETIDSWKR